MKHLVYSLPDAGEIYGFICLPTLCMMERRENATMLFLKSADLFSVLIHVNQQEEKIEQ